MDIFYFQKTKTKFFLNLTLVFLDITLLLFLQYFICRFADGLSLSRNNYRQQLSVSQLSPSL